MEALLFLAFAQRAHVRAGVLCTVIVNRLKGDQVTSTHEQLDQYMIDNWTLLSKLVKEHPSIEDPIEYFHVYLKQTSSNTNNRSDFPFIHYQKSLGFGTWYYSISQ